jgi:hypothetical protein
LSPDLRVVVFGLFVAYVFITAFNFLVVGIYNRLRRRRPEYSRAYRLTSRISLVLGFIGLLCVLYGRFIEPQWPEITHVELRTAKVAKETGKVRIVHISDLHTALQPVLELRLPQLIADQKPDFIVYTGDSLASRTGLPTFRKLIAELTRIAPVYAPPATGMSPLRSFLSYIRAPTSSISRDAM